MTIKLLVPDMPKADDLLPYLRQIDLNRHYTNFGPLNTELEQRLVAYFQRKQPDFTADIHVTTVANATLGLEVVFAALNLPKDAQVLIPALTFPATATAAVRQGLVPVFSGIDPDSWLLTPEIAYEAIKINPHINLIVPVATFGTPVDVVAWDQFIEDTGIPVVIDAAGAFSNQLAGKKAHVVFSLHATKSLGGGEGGFIITTDDELVARIRILSNFGIEPDHDGKIFDLGTNAKLSEYHAAVTQASLDRWAVRQALRMDLLELWLDRLSPLMEAGHIEIQQDMELYSHSLLPLRFKGVDDVSRLMKYLADRNIQSRRWYYPLLPGHPAFSSYETIGNILSAAELSAELLGLPFHLDLEVDDIDYIVGVISEYLDISIGGQVPEEMVA